MTNHDCQFDWCINDHAGGTGGDGGTGSALGAGGGANADLYVTEAILLAGISTTGDRGSFCRYKARSWPCHRHDPARVIAKRT